MFNKDVLNYMLLINALATFYTMLHIELFADILFSHFSFPNCVRLSLVSITHISFPFTLSSTLIYDAKSENLYFSRITTHRIFISYC